MTAPDSRYDIAPTLHDVNDYRGLNDNESSAGDGRYALTAGFLGGAYHHSHTMPPSASAPARANPRDYVTSKKTPLEPDYPHGKTAYSMTQSEPPSFSGFAAARRVRTEPSPYEMRQQQQYEEEERQQFYHHQQVKARTLPPIHEALGFAVFAPRPPIPPLPGSPEANELNPHVNVPSSADSQQSHSRQERHEYEPPKPAATPRGVSPVQRPKEEKIDRMNMVSPPLSSVPPPQSLPGSPKGRKSTMSCFAPGMDHDFAPSKLSSKFEEQKQRREDLVIQQLEMFDSNKVFIDYEHDCRRLIDLCSYKLSQSGLEAIMKKLRLSDVDDLIELNRKTLDVLMHLRNRVDLTQVSRLQSVAQRERPPNVHHPWSSYDRRGEREGADGDGCFASPPITRPTNRYPVTYGDRDGICSSTDEATDIKMKPMVDEASASSNYQRLKVPRSSRDVGHPSHRRRISFDDGSAWLKDCPGADEAGCHLPESLHPPMSASKRRPRPPSSRAQHVPFQPYPSAAVQRQQQQQRPPAKATSVSFVKTESKERIHNGILNSRIRKSKGATPGRCHSCHRVETPEWRRGPDGARTLCNACGLHYAKLTRKSNPSKPANNDSAAATTNGANNKNNDNENDKDKDSGTAFSAAASYPSFSKGNTISAAETKKIAQAMSSRIASSPNLSSYEDAKMLTGPSIAPSSRPSVTSSLHSRPFDRPSMDRYSLHDNQSGGYYSPRASYWQQQQHQQPQLSTRYDPHR